jgi:hypothetical protein
LAVLFPRTYQAIITSAGSRVRGRWIAGTETIINFTGNIQPIENIAVDSLSIGRREIGQVIVYTDYVFNIMDEATSQNGDFVIYNNERYEITSVDKWEGHLAHFEYKGDLRKNDPTEVLP